MHAGSKNTFAYSFIPFSEQGTAYVQSDVLLNCNCKHKNVDSFLTALGPSQLVPGAKRSERGTNHAPPSSVEVKNPFKFASVSPCVFMARYLSAATTLQNVHRAITLTLRTHEPGF